jgi:hypothetical protein
MPGYCINAKVGAAWLSMCRSLTMKSGIGRFIRPSSAAAGIAGAAVLLAGCVQPPATYLPVPLEASAAVMRAYLREQEFRREQAMQQYAPLPPTTRYVGPAAPASQPVQAEMAPAAPQAPPGVEPGDPCVGWWRLCHLYE